MPPDLRNGPITEIKVDQITKWLYKNVRNHPAVMLLEVEDIRRVHGDHVFGDGHICLSTHKTTGILQTVSNWSFKEPNDNDMKRVENIKRGDKVNVKGQIVVALMTDFTGQDSQGHREVMGAFLQFCMDNAELVKGNKVASK